MPSHKEAGDEEKRRTCLATLKSLSIAEAGMLLLRPEPHSCDVTALHSSLTSKGAIAVFTVLANIPKLLKFEMSKLRGWKLTMILGTEVAVVDE